MNYDGVVFDMDGVLVEPSGADVMREASVRAFEACGIPDPPAEDVDAITFSIDPDRFDQLCADHGIRPRVFFRTRDALASRAQIRTARDGGKPTYDDASVLADLDEPMGVVSSNQQATVDYLLAQSGLADYFDVSYGRPPTVADLRRKKPDPHFLELAMADLDISDPLFVGDSESDVLAARNAGVDVAFVRRDHSADVSLSVEPEHEVSDLEELRALLGR